MTVAVHQGDCREVIKALGDNSVDSIVTDPPYHLVAMTKRFGAANAAPAKSTDHQRIARGFMSTEWDGSGIAFDPETWRALAAPLRPGGYLLAFGAPRTYHRLACAIEDAGFVIQDCLMWMFGQGWPKRRDMLKPAYEPIVMAYKPGGARFLNIDGCRIETAENLNGGTYSPGGKNGPLPGDGRSGKALGMFQPGSKPKRGYEQPPGRWPSNVALDDSNEVAEAFEAVGERTSGVGAVKRASGSGYRPNAFGRESRPEGTPNIEYGDSGSVARFFWHAKAGSEDRWGSRHPAVKPVELVRYFARLVTPPGGLVLDCFAGSGTTGVAALAEGFDCILIEREEQYVADIKERLAFYEGGGTHSVQAKNRNRKTDAGPLFDQAPEDPAARVGREECSSTLGEVQCRNSIGIPQGSSS